MMRNWRLIAAFGILVLLMWASFLPALNTVALPDTATNAVPPTTSISLSAISEIPSFYTTTISIPTYPYEAYLGQAFNPTYNITYTVLNWDAYNAAQPSPTPRDYLLLVMENDYLQVTVMPELGGRIYQLIDKTTGYNHLYQNSVIKPTHWGPPEQGWWMAVGGIEWCLPVEEHGYEWGIPWHWDAITSTTGVTVTVWDTNATDRLRASVDIFLPVDRAALSVTPHLENPTTTTIDYKFWSNAALAPGSLNKPAESLEFILNTDEVAIHSTSDERLPGAMPVVPSGPDYRITWPEYNGVDFSRLANWDEWIGVFVYPQTTKDFAGVYVHAEEIGVVRVFPKHILRGTKAFGYGWESPIPWSIWSDEDSGGVELHGGVAPTFWDIARLGPGETLSWSEQWYPVRGTTGASTATQEAALHVSAEGRNVRIRLNTTISHTWGTTHLQMWDKTTCVELDRQDLPTMVPLVPYSTTMTMGSRPLDQLVIAYLDKSNNVLAQIGDVDCLNATPPVPHLGYGINVRNYDVLDDLVVPLDFEWIKIWEEYMWEEKGTAMPTDPLPSNVLYLINCGGYINDLNAWGEHVEELARAGLGIVDAYEICNETNVKMFWNNQSPDPARFTEMLCIADARIKAVDPQAFVVSGGLAPVGRIPGTCETWPGNNCSAMDERLYLQGMLDAGAGACIDAFGYHPYGFAYSPETDPITVENGFTFRGAEIMHDILVDQNAAMPVWATEFNWIRQPTEDGDNCDGDPDYVTNFKWQEVSAQTQSDYLVRAFQYADTQWPWMQGMFIWNLDWHDYRPELPCLHSRYYSVRKDDGSDLGTPAPAYTTLAAMEKRPGLLISSQLAVTPTERVLLVDLSRPSVLTTSFVITNIGFGTFTWTAQIASPSYFTPTLSMTSGVPGDVLWVGVDPMAVEMPEFPGTTTLFGPGTFSTTLKISTIPTDVLDAPQYLTLIIQATPELDHVYLPLILNRYIPSTGDPYTHDSPQGPSKIGTHAIGDGGTVELVQMVKDGGAHVAVVKGLSFGYLKDVKEISPETVTIGRWSDWRWEAIRIEGDIDAREQAELYMQQHMSQWEPHKAYVDYWEILNEVDPSAVEKHVWMAQFFIECMDIAEANGYRLALFSYSMGVPEIYEWEAMAETGVFAVAKQGGHILSLHEYARPMDARWGEAMPSYPGQDPNDPDLPRYEDRGVLTGRYRHLYRDILIPRNEVIPLVITECNIANDDPEERAETFVEEMIWYDDRLREDEYVIGMNIFTLGGNSSGWGHFDFYDFLPELAEHIISVKDE